MNYKEKLEDKIFLDEIKILKVQLINIKISSDFFIHSLCWVYQSSTTINIKLYFDQ